MLSPKFILLACLLVAFASAKPNGIGSDPIEHPPHHHSSEEKESDENSGSESTSSGVIFTNIFWQLFCPKVFAQLFSNDS